MAKLVRKVDRKQAKASRKAEGGAWYQRLLHNKLAMGIIIGVVVAGAGVGIGFGIYNAVKSDDEENTEYFRTEYLLDNGYFTEENEVDFTFVNYRGLQYYANTLEKKYDDTAIENIFVFCYSSESFTIDEDTALSKNTNKQLLNRLIDFQREINKKKEAGTDVEFFVMDLAIGDNEDILSDSFFVGESEDASSASMLFTYVTDGKCVATFDYGTKDSNGNTVIQNKSIFGYTATSVLNTTIPNAMNFLKQDLVNAVAE